MSINVTKLFELEIGSKNPFPSFLEANYFLDPSSVFSRAPEKLAL